MRLIADGVVDRDGVVGLSQRLGFSQRHLRRIMTEEVGAGPIALARAQRAQSARALLDSTDMPLVEIAFAAGFGSVRQFNETIQTVFGSTPSALRHRNPARQAGISPGAIELRLAHREPFDGPALLEFLAARAIAGVEEVVDGSYRRSLRLPFGAGVVQLTPKHGSIHCTLHLSYMRDLTAAVARCRRLLDLDADPSAVDDVLGRDRVLRGLVRTRPGLRIPGCIDGSELAIRAGLGEDTSVHGARMAGKQLVERFGIRLVGPFGSVTHLFPTAEALAAADPESLPGPKSRRETLHTLARRIADGTLALDSGADSRDAVCQLRAIRGVGARMASYVSMRGLGDPDVFLTTDPQVRHSLERLLRHSHSRSPAAVTDGWRPWRSYATLHLLTIPGPGSAPSMTTER